MTKDIKGYVVKIAWADNGWEGFDQRGFKNKDKYGYEFVKNYGYAHEWWNYYEGFDTDYFYGRVEMRTPSKKIDDCIVIFIAKNIYNDKFFFIGFYDGANYKEIEIDDELLELLPRTYIESIDKEKDEYIISVFNNRKFDSNFQALKAQSTSFDSAAYLEVESNEVGIERFGQAAFSYIGDSERCSPKQILKLLIKVKKNHLGLLSSTDDDMKRVKLKSILEKIDKVIEKYFKRYWKIAPGEGARLWEKSKTEETISIGWSVITHNLGDKILDYKNYNDFKNDVDFLYDENKDNIEEKFKFIDTSAKRAAVTSQIWIFINDINIGDIIIANRGTKKIIGRGVIKSKPWIDKSHEYAIIRETEWLDKDLNIDVPSEIMGKFNRTINELKREEYELIFKGIPERNEYDLEIFKKIENLLKYKNQVILYGPPGTGKTYIAREFGKFFNKKSYYLISEIIVPDRNYYWWVIKPENWYIIENGLKTKNLVELKYEQGIKFKHAFDTIREEDIVFIYEASPIKQIKVIAEVVVKDGLKAMLRLLGEIEGPKFEQLKEHTVIKNSKPIKMNLQGSLFEFEKKYISDLIELTDAKKLRAIEAFLEYRDKIDLIHSITFHQSYAYEEFLEGLKPLADDEGKIKYVVEEGLFKKVCRDALNALLHHSGLENRWKESLDVPTLNKSEINIVKEKLKGNNFPKSILIIDEINRGDISRIFGELISLLEVNKRLFAEEEFITTLPYSKIKFGVPPNLYIIATLNTADRSIALLDIALRRRFGFVELMPEYGILKKILLDNEVDPNVYNMRKLTISALNIINDRIAENYDRDHQIGHSYFISLKDETSIDESKEKLKLIWVSEIIPLLREYFYDSPKKIKSVLNKVKIDEIEEKDIISALERIIASENEVKQD
ncbi:MAG: AAA family ATPase [Candidatus Thorarchaeota archaeon]